MKLSLREVNDMLDFIRRLINKSNSDNSGSDLRKQNSNVSDTTLWNEKICPKCKATYPIQSVICAADSTLLMLLRQPTTDVALDLPVTAKRADETEFEVVLGRHLGSGSICEVYEATETSSGEKFAAKVLMHKLLLDSKSERRFVEGARLGLELEHETIVRTYGVGGSKQPKLDKLYAVTICEYLNGRSLAQMIDKRYLPTATEVLAIASDVCAALNYAHSRGIIHGDLKPSNVFLDVENGKGIVKVSDFGIAQRLFRNLEWNKVSTLTSSVYGCATYFAPEYVNSRETTAVADVYSLGCLMYECLTGTPPFVGANDFVTIMMHINQAPKSFSAEYTPPEVADIVMRALKKDPAERWQSAEQMHVAIKICQEKLKDKAKQYG